MKRQSLERIDEPVRKHVRRRKTDGLLDFLDEL